MKRWPRGYRSLESHCGPGPENLWPDQNGAWPSLKWSREARPGPWWKGSWRACPGCPRSPASQRLAMGAWVRRCPVKLVSGARAQQCRLSISPAFQTGRGGAFPDWDSLNIVQHFAEVLLQGLAHAWVAQRSALFVGYKENVFYPLAQGGNFGIGQPYPVLQ